ncbi:SixA phosphatase family protein [Caenimonas terrae]|uniref:SixA phosphatase family protein n=1 Tax=Caenimonas terrae TaxID=696074 RepID=A0ABW0NAD1_9BURK
MDLILWRHAEAEDPYDGQSDLQRALTPRGEKQAARMAVWLDRHLPDSARILCSPALRCEQTVLPLGRKYKLSEALAPDMGVDKLLEGADWPHSRPAVLVVGHQPTLGQAVARLIGVSNGDFPIRKGAVWWLRSRERDGHQQTVVLSVQSPDLV